MNKVEARAYFAHFLLKSCPECYASVGEMCVENRSVWIHFERMQLFNTKKPPDKIPLNIDSPFVVAIKRLNKIIVDFDKRLSENQSRRRLVGAETKAAILREQASRTKLERNIQVERRLGSNFVKVYASVTQAALDTEHVPLWKML